MQSNWENNNVKTDKTRSDDTINQWRLSQWVTDWWFGTGKQTPFNMSSFKENQPRWRPLRQNIQQNKGKYLLDKEYPAIFCHPVIPWIWKPGAQQLHRHVYSSYTCIWLFYLPPSSHAYTRDCPDKVMSLGKKIRLWI